MLLILYQFLSPEFKIGPVLSPAGINQSDCAAKLENTPIGLLYFPYFDVELGFPPFVEWTYSFFRIINEHKKLNQNVFISRKKTKQQQMEQNNTNNLISLRSIIRAGFFRCAWIFCASLLFFSRAKQDEHGSGW